MTTSIVCPDLNGEEVSLQIDMNTIWEAENRIPDIATVNSFKAPELLSVFNRAYLYCHEQMTKLEYEVHRMETIANKRKSIVLLDIVPEYLESKNMSNGKNRMGSEDIRTAILNLDEEYGKITETIQQNRCILELVKGKMKGFEMAFTSVKKILGDSTFNMNKNKIGN